MRLVDDGRALDTISDAVDEGKLRSGRFPADVVNITYHSEQAQGPGKEVGRKVSVRRCEGQGRLPPVRGSLRPREELLPRAARCVHV